MADHGKTKWLLRELAAWECDGTVDAQTAERLRARYAAAREGAGWRQAVLCSLGALLVGLGIIAVLAANWADLSRPACTVIAFTPLMFCAALWFVGEVKSWRSVGFTEPLGIFWSLAVGAGISLVSQTYHISGTSESFTLTWTLLLLPVMYATRSASATAGFFAGLLTWAIMQNTGDMPTCLLYWPLAMAAVPLLVWMRRREDGVRAGIMVWSAALCSVAALAFSLERDVPGLWRVMYTGAFSSLLLAGWMFEERAVSIWRTPMRTIGGAGLAVVLYLMNFKWSWELRSAYSRTNPGSWERWLVSLDLWIAYGFILLAAVLLVFGVSRMIKSRERSVGITAWSLSAFLVSALHLARIPERAVPALAVSCALFVLGVVTIAEGFKTRAMRLVNAGIVVALAVIAGKFFAEEYSLTRKGLAFMLCGAFFYATNFWASRRLKKIGAAE